VQTKFRCGRVSRSFRALECEQYTPQELRDKNMTTFEMNKKQVQTALDALICLHNDMVDEIGRIRKGSVTSIQSENLFLSAQVVHIRETFEEIGLEITKIAACEENK
jgi:hypothetical protein